jgi:hypothetical protein
MHESKAPDEERVPRNHRAVSAAAFTPAWAIPLATAIEDRVIAFASSHDRDVVGRRRRSAAAGCRVPT